MSSGNVIRTWTLLQQTWVWLGFSVYNEHPVTVMQVLEHRTGQTWEEEEGC